MTVTTETVRVAYTGNGTTTAFAAPFLFLANTDLRVYLGSVLQSSGFTVTGAGVGTGTVTFTNAPASGVAVVIVCRVSPVQDMDLVPNDPLPADTMERAFDRAARHNHFLEAQDGRAIRVAEHEAPLAVLPAAAARAGRSIGFNATTGDLELAALGTLPMALVSETADGLMSKEDKKTFNVRRFREFHVDDYLPSTSYDTATLNCTTFINNAFADALANVSGSAVIFGHGKTYRTEGTVNISGLNTVIEGNNASVDYQGSGVAVDCVPYLGTIYNQRISLRSLKIDLRVGTVGLRARMSHSSVDELDVFVRDAAPLGAAAVQLVGDETDGTGAYYNIFTRCQLQSASLSLKHIGVEFAAAAPTFRSPNANQWIGGRIGQFATAFRLRGSGNSIITPTVENITARGVVFDVLSPAVGATVGNKIIGGYVENAATLLSIGSGCAATYVDMPYYTGVTTEIVNSGTFTHVMNNVLPSRMPTGIDFVGAIASTGTKVLDDYEEGTWTPTVAGGSTPGTYTVTVNAARYTKVGRVVTVTGNISVTTVSAGSGTLRIGGLPFSKAANDPQSGSVSTSNVVLNSAIRSLSTTQFTSSVDTTFAIMGSRDGTTPLYLTCADLNSPFSIEFTMTYTQV